MKPIEIILIVCCVVFVLSVIIHNVINKKKGKTSCGCDCARCHGSCHKNSTQKNPNDE